VVVDERAGPFSSVTGDVLIAGPDARVAPTHYRDWLAAAR